MRAIQLFQIFRCFIKYLSEKNHTSKQKNKKKNINLSHAVKLHYLQAPIGVAIGLDKIFFFICTNLTQTYPYVFFFLFFLRLLHQSYSEVHTDSAILRFLLNHYVRFIRFIIIILFFFMYIHLRVCINVGLAPRGLLER